MVEKAALKDLTGELVTDDDVEGGNADSKVDLSKGRNGFKVLRGSFASTCMDEYVKEVLGRSAPGSVGVIA